MGSDPTETKNQWPISRIVRLVVPSLVVLLVALVLRDREHRPSAPPERHAPSGVSADGLQAPTSACRLLLLGEEAGTLAESLRPKLRDDIVLVLVPRAAQRDLMRSYAVTSLPAVIVERPNAKAAVCQGEKASLAPVLDECRALGLLKAPE